jgi:hypothetical protein
MLMAINLESCKGKKLDFSDNIPKTPSTTTARIMTLTATGNFIKCVIIDFISKLVIDENSTENP